MVDIDKSDSRVKVDESIGVVPVIEGKDSKDFTVEPPIAIASMVTLLSLPMPEHIVRKARSTVIILSRRDRTKQAEVSVPLERRIVIIGKALDHHAIAIGIEEAIDDLGRRGLIGHEV